MRKERLTELAEQFVSGLVTAGIVDDLELIEIENQENAVKGILRGSGKLFL